MSPLLRLRQYEITSVVDGLEYVDAADAGRPRDIDWPFRKLIAANDHVLQGRIRGGLIALDSRERTWRVRVEKTDVFNTLRDIEDDTRLGDLVIVGKKFPVERDWGHDA